MKVIYNQTLTGISLATGTADPAYPLANLLNRNPRIPFRTASGVSSCVVRVAEPGTATAVAIVGTNAATVKIGSATYSPRAGALFVDIPATGTARYIRITLSAPAGAQVEVGCLFIGQTLRFRDFEHDTYQCSFKDLSVEVETNDGTPYYKFTRILREPSGRVVMLDAAGPDLDGYNSYPEFLEMVWRRHGKTPMPWHISAQGRDITIFAGLSSSPIEVRHGLQYVMVAMALREIA